MLKLYHFCAMRQEHYGLLTYTSGTVKADIDLSNGENYSLLKQKITDYINKNLTKNLNGATDIVLLSLTVLETYQESVGMNSDIQFNATQQG